MRPPIAATSSADNSVALNTQTLQDYHLLNQILFFSFIEESRGCIII